MSLQVWLPLNGDLHNQGLKQSSIITSTNFSSSNTGKIGTCMKITSTTDLKYIPNFNTDELSFGGWFKFNKSEIEPIITGATYSSSATTPTGNLLGNTNYGGIGLVWTGNNYYSSNSFNSISVFATLRTSSVNNSTSGFTIDFDTWTHIVLTWNPTTHILSIYKNGILHNSKTFNNFTDGVSRTLYLNYKAIYGGNGPSLNIPIYCNDIRIYNHCLSNNEIKNWSKGLVLHYPLNQGNENLLSNYVTPGQNAPGSITTAGRTNYYGNYGIIIPATENADTYFRLFLKQQLTQGQTYTISCYVSGLLSGTYYNFPLFAQGNTSMGVLRLDHNGLCSLTFTMNSSSQTAITTPEGTTVYICFMDDAGRTLASGQGAIIVNGFKLEKGNSCTNNNFFENNLIYDSSGYCHNGSLNGNLTSIIANPKYNNTILFNSNTINLSSIFTDNTNQCHTVSAWIYPTGTNDAILINFNSGYKLYHGNGGRSLMYLNSGTYDSYVYGSTIPTNTWTFITWVLDTKSYTCKVYYNGILNANSSNYSGSDIPSGINKNLTIGSGVLGYITDIHIYATALTAEDIKELYKSSKIINGTNKIPRDLE